MFLNTGGRVLRHYKKEHAAVFLCLIALVMLGTYQAEYVEHLVATWCGADRAETFRDVPPAASAELYRQAGARRLLDAVRRQGLVYDPFAPANAALH